MGGLNDLTGKGRALVKLPRHEERALVAAERRVLFHRGGQRVSTMRAECSAPRSNTEGLQKKPRSDSPNVALSP